MKFKDKIVILRKKNNLSQEALAEKLNMSRQAISKWESGNSYPDMNTMLKVCEVLNCRLDELLDDNALGSSNFLQQNKININKWIKEILDFITRFYNMFFSMKFKDKIKFIIEMCFIILVLFLGFILIHEVLENTIYDLFFILPYDFYSIIVSFLNAIYTFFSIVLGGIIFIHLLKIRYLDYYVTIEDNEIESKQIEKEIDKKEYKYIEKKREKIIIRDPKHTTYSFFSGLGKIMFFLLKVFVFIILIPFVCTFILLCICGTVSIAWIKYGVIFVGILIASVGALLINYDFLEIGIKFLFNKTNKFIKLFIIFILGLFICGIGSGICLSQINTFEIIDYSEYYKTKDLELDMSDNLVFYELDSNLIEFNNSVSNVIINVSYSENIDIYLDNHYGECYSVHYDYNNSNFIDLILNDLKDKKLRDYDNNLYKINKIIISESNYNKLIENNNIYFGYEYESDE